MSVENHKSITVSIEEVKKRSVSGVLALISRTFIVQIISFIATLLLTYYLDPAIYGIFYLVSSVVNFLAYFSDVGLAAALIQKKDDIDDEDLATTFTVQQILILSLLVILFFITPYIKKFYNIDDAGIFLLFAMAVSLFLSSLKTIPSIMLEREIRFNQLIVPQILETLVFNLIAVYFAYKGFGIYAFAYAVLARGVVGLVSMYIIYPWKPTLGIYKNSLKGLLKFGLPYQANTFLAVLKDDGMTILLTKIIGTTGLGYIGWASRWAGLPLRIVMDNLTKVSFPTFSRLQNDKEKLAKAIEVSLMYLCLVSFPILIGMGFFAKPMITLIPKYTKWLPAIIPLYLYLYNSAWASISTSLTNLLNATGKIKTTFKLMLMWTGLTWVLMPLFAIKMGFIGIAYAVAIIATSSVITVILAKKIVKFSLINIFKTPIVSSLLMALFLTFTIKFGQSFPALAVIALISSIIYISAIFLIEGKQFITTSIKYFKFKNV